jgi:hypothetical protein
MINSNDPNHHSSHPCKRDNPNITLTNHQLAAQVQAVKRGKRAVTSAPGAVGALGRHALLVKHVANSKVYARDTHDATAAQS